MAQPEASSSFLAILFSGLAHSLIYGSNMVLFGTVMYLLRQRKERENAMFHMVSTMLLFLFATITAVVNFLSTVEELGHLATFDFRVNLLPCRVIYLVTLQLVDALAFIILLHRCFNIWEGNYQVVVLPALMMLGTTSVFYAQFSEYIKIQHTPVIDQIKYTTIVHDSIAFSTAALFLNIGANILLTSLIAGRLWWIRRRLQQLVPNGTFFNKYTSLIFMTLESGMMIPIALTIYAVFTIRIKEGRSGHAALTVMNALLPQIMVFAPLLIMFRVGLGITVDRDHINMVSLPESDLQMCSTVPGRLSPVTYPLTAISTQHISIPSESAFHVGEVKTPVVAHVAIDRIHV